MSNVAIFKNHLQKVEVNMEEVNQKDGGVFFRTRQDMDNGGSVVIIVSFNKEQTTVDLNVFGIATIKNPLKKEAVHNLINELNLTYRFTKFTESDGMISAQYSYGIEPDNLDPEFLLDMIVMLLDSAKEGYPKFMKLQWA